MIRMIGFVYIIPGILYFTFFIYQLLKKTYLHKKFDNKYMLACVFIVVVVFSLPATYFINAYGTIYFHLLVISILIEVLHQILKCFHLEINLFIRGASALIILLALFTYGYFNMMHIVKTDYEISSKKIDHLKIAQISDLHMSTTMDVNKFSDICDDISKDEPDIVVLTGDIFDENTTYEAMKDTCYELSQISNTMGIYYIYGNHDAFSNRSRADFNEEDINENLKNNGIVVLNDEVVNLQGITIVGRKDAHFSGDNHRLSAKELLKTVNKDNYIVVLDHQPLDLEQNALLGADLQLSGHTHGGQMFPMRQIESLYSNRLVYGIRKLNDFYAITSSGIAGWGYPIKTGALSEYVMIEIN